MGVTKSLKLNTWDSYTESLAVLNVLFGNYFDGLVLFKIIMISNSKLLMKWFW